MSYRDYEAGNISKDSVAFWRVFKTIIIYAIATVIICVQVYRLGDAFRYWWGNKEVKKVYVQEIDNLEQQQKSMREELNNLKYNTLTNERLARSMGYVKPNEIVYKFTTSKNERSVDE